MATLTDAQRIAAIIQDLQCLPLHQGQGGQPEQNITISRSIISFLDQNYLLHRAGSPPEQVLIISKLQDVAYHDAETGGIQDIAQWCNRQWLRLLQQYPASSIVLQSKSLQARQLRPMLNQTELGHSWLLRSQFWLARIQVEEGSGGSSGSGIPVHPPPTADEIGSTHSAADLNFGRYGPDYVEARGTLVPATEYFDRAVNAAHAESRLSGQLLTLVSHSC